ncbi:MAG TPA: thymidine kinase [Fimbriimonas sp.]|nr:thymidine kinase [Fimbriimonas sp.]
MARAETLPRPKPLGQITVVCGSMFAGKTEELIRLARRALYAKRKVQVFKPRIDDRYHQTMVVTHMGVQHEALPVASVDEIRKKLRANAQTILIEEAQFFDASIVDLAVELADAGKDVILAGLDQDFRRQPFGPMPQLLSVADQVVKLRAICMKCGATASHTYRQIDGRPAREDDPIILIGANETYEARCRNCYRLLPAKKPRRVK